MPHQNLETTSENPYTNTESFRKYVEKHGFPKGHTTGRPLSAESSNFVGREAEIAQIFQHLINNQSLLIYGEPMSGKTSLINRVISLGPKMLPKYYFNDQYVELINLNYHSSEISDQDLERQIRKLIEHCPITKIFDKYVFTIDEASNIERLQKLGNLKKLMAKVINTEEENILLLLVGHVPIEKVATAMEKNGVQKLIRSVFVRKPEQRLPDWYPKEEMFLEPIVPTKFFPNHKTND